MKHLFTNHIIKPTLRFMNRSNLGFFWNTVFAKIVLLIRLFEAFTYKYKITKTKIGYVICDVHLGMGKYKKGELKPLINLIKAGKKIFILGDFTEWLVSIKKYNTYEKKVLNYIVKGIQNGNVFYIRGNHDNCALKKYWKNYMIVDNILLIHGDFLTHSFRPFCLGNK